MKYLIVDWAHNVCFNGKKFKTWYDAEDFLSVTLNDSYENDRQEYYIVLESEAK